MSYKKSQNLILIKSSTKSWNLENNTIIIAAIIILKIITI